MWVETAMNLTGKELRIMERLARAQVQKKTKKKISTEKLRSNYAMQSVLK
jgi:hypothetical protein